MKVRVITGIFVLVCVLCACGCVTRPDTGILSQGSGTDFSESARTLGNDLAPISEKSVKQDVDPSFEHQIILSASLDIIADDVEIASRELSGIASNYGGFISSSRLSRDGNGRISGTAVLRVPTGYVDAALHSIRFLGTVQSESTNMEEVGEEYIDLQARLEAFTNQKEQYLRIIEKAESVQDILLVQGEIERVQVEIERITGRIRYLDDRTELATISITLREPAGVAGPAGHDIVTVFNQAIKAFLNTLDVLIILFFALLPLLLLGGAALYVFKWVKGRRSAPVANNTEKKN